MKRSLNDGSGYLSIDHRESPGVDPATLPAGFVTAPRGEHLERDIKQCSHCQRGVVLNPGRVRQRAVCQKCYSYICDECEAKRVATGGACVPFKMVLDRAETILEQYRTQPDHPALEAANHLDVLTEPAAPRIVLTDAR
jgi:hypothetical protein